MTVSVCERANGAAAGHEHGGHRGSMTDKATSSSPCLLEVAEVRRINDSDTLQI